MTEKEFNRIFADNLNYYMVKTSTSRADLSKLLNVSVTSVANWCNALKTPRMDKVDRICAHFGIKRSDLMSERTADPPDTSSPYGSGLTASEIGLIADYRQLNEYGQEKVCEYASDLVGSGRYKKRDQSGLVEKNA